MIREYGKTVSRKFRKGEQRESIPKNRDNYPVGGSETRPAFPSLARDGPRPCGTGLGCQKGEQRGELLFPCRPGPPRFPAINSPPVPVQVHIRPPRHKSVDLTSGLAVSFDFFEHTIWRCNLTPLRASDECGADTGPVFRTAPGCNHAHARAGQGYAAFF